MQEHCIHKIKAGNSLTYRSMYQVLNILSNINKGFSHLNITGIAIIVVFLYLIENDTEICQQKHSINKPLSIADTYAWQKYGPKIPTANDVKLEHSW